MNIKHVLRSSNAYTLIELIVVFVIVVALFLASLPIYVSSRDKMQFNQAINSVNSFLDSAVELANSPDSTLKNSDGVCVMFNENTNEILSAVKPNTENSCSKSIVADRMKLGEEYGISCKQCNVLLPVFRAGNTIGYSATATITRNKLQKTISISPLGVVNAK